MTDRIDDGDGGDLLPEFEEIVAARNVLNQIITGIANGVFGVIMSETTAPFLTIVKDEPPPMRTTTTMRTTYDASTEEEAETSVGFLVLRSDDGREFEIPFDRLHPWHTVYVEPDSWNMSHPITCSLSTCAFNAKGKEWSEPPAPVGSVVRWGPEFDDWEIQEGNDV